MNVVKEDFHRGAVPSTAIVEEFEHQARWRLLKEEQQNIDQIAGPWV